MLGVAAGLLFTVSHVAVKAATGGAGVLETAPFVLVALAAGVGAFFASARSLQIGEGVAVIAVTAIASNASSIPAGIVVFGDPLGEGAATIVVRCLAFVLVVVAATLIPGRPGRPPWPPAPSPALRDAPARGVDVPMLAAPDQPPQAVERVPHVGVARIERRDAEPDRVGPAEVGDHRRALDQRAADRPRLGVADRDV